MDTDILLKEQLLRQKDNDIAKLILQLKSAESQMKADRIQYESNKKRDEKEVTLVKMTLQAEKNRRK